MIQDELPDYGELTEEVWARIKRRVEVMVAGNRILWRDDGTDIGRGSIIDLTGTVTKSGNVISIAGASATLPNETYISFGLDPLNVQVFLP